ncbi:MAE_28990/MAE_18760 family HEPN-like nuclease [Buttiauxella massiliensis]|uniref:MAE_28990/MAE_18760 family HEPN-like nuclease n=1 Tax=Buttiauxella massiliensis TaxID=2831590 RepID=UPI00125FF7F9|nr:MAE_28990/MAE_18760 family HEPN-like nuclease [Buttiauxella massiliensis]
MPFTSVSSGTTDRLRLCSLLLSHISSVEESQGAFTDDLARMQKGVFFVQLYAAIEFTVTNSFSTFLELIAAQPLAPKHYEPALLSVLLDSKFKALLASSKKHIWRKKYDLLNHAFGENVCEVDTNIFPGAGMNISIAEIKDMWFFLGLDCDPLPEGVFPQLLAEIKEHRNAIAHGRECAHEIGARFTLEQLKKKHTDVELLCHYIISTINSHYSANFLPNEAE